MVSIIIDNELQIRSYQPEDAAELFRIVNESRTHLRQWMTWVDNTTKKEHSLHFIQQSLQQLNTQEAMALGIFYKQKIIGGIGMHQWNHQLKKAQIGYWIAKGFEGKGIVTKCTERFADFLFEKLKLNKIEIHFVVKNNRSAAIAKKLGAKTEGILRASYSLNGQLEDLVVTGILKSEWKMEN